MRLHDITRHQEDTTDARPVGSLDQVRSLGTIVGLWAHPDDETYLAGGLYALAAHAGQRVVSVSATAGEQGAPPGCDTQALGIRRRRELRAALRELGVREHAVLGYPDGGCPDIDPRVGVASFTSVLEKVRPDTIVTFGPDGLTGHPDHRAVSGWATRAWQLVCPEARLLYVTTAPGFAERHRELHETIDAFAPGLPLATPVDDLAMRLRLDDWALGRKVAALRRHHSQTRVVEDLVGTDAFVHWWDEECYVDAERVTLPDELPTLTIAAPALVHSA